MSIIIYLSLMYMIAWIRNIIICLICRRHKKSFYPLGRKVFVKDLKRLSCINCFSRKDRMELRNLSAIFPQRLYWVVAPFRIRTFSCNNQWRKPHQSISKCLQKEQSKYKSIIPGSVPPTEVGGLQVIANRSRNKSGNKCISLVWFVIAIFVRYWK